MGILFLCIVKDEAETAGEGGNMRPVSQDQMGLLGNFPQAVIERIQIPAVVGREVESFCQNPMELLFAAYIGAVDGVFYIYSSP
jgi:hypothetical protein